MTKRIITVLLVCGMLTGIAYAARIAWKPTEEPPISLRLALTLAEEELKTEDTAFFCLSAAFIGVWEFHFGSKTGKELWVVAGNDHKIRKSTEAFEH